MYNLVYKYIAPDTSSLGQVLLILADGPANATKQIMDIRLLKVHIVGFDFCISEYRS